MENMTNAQALIARAQADVKPLFEELEETVYANQVKVLEAFRARRIELRHFAQSNGYGYDDLGRDTLDLLYAQVFGAEKALVRPQLVSGTHALSVALFGVAQPGKTIYSISGQPYDTLLDTIGKPDDDAQVLSLKQLGVGYRQEELLANGDLALSNIENVLQTDRSINVVYLQRSRGYAWRDSFRISALKEAFCVIGRLRPDVCIMVDNCYGEFVEQTEPLEVGADIIVGSLIKNPGGGLAPTGAYIAGKAAYIDRIQYRLTAPGIGAEVGSWPAGYQPFYQGLFLAPHVVGESLKGAILAARVFELMGMKVLPTYDAPRADIIQSIEFGSEENLLKFCAAVQAASPIDSHLTPEPWDMPGYQHKIVMAAGAFTQGASLELSADAPIKPPYIGYMQGGLTFEHCKYALTRIVEKMRLQ
ncbi:MAG: methionine gamma-lyase family protein [Eubacteriales bacterium]|nr:methionine gamma-lyase family protein [Eubacteriales bacterium]